MESGREKHTRQREKESWRMRAGQRMMRENKLTKHKRQRKKQKYYKRERKRERERQRER